MLIDLQLCCHCSFFISSVYIKKTCRFFFFFLKKHVGSFAPILLIVLFLLLNYRGIYKRILIFISKVFILDEIFLFK